MACIVSPADGSAVMTLSRDQTGNGDSQHIMDRGPARIAALVRLWPKTAGACTVNIKGSMDVSLDPASFYNIPYTEADNKNPALLSVDPIVLNAAGNYYFWLKESCPWRFLKLVYSGNTMTITADVAY